MRATSTANVGHKKISMLVRFLSAACLHAFFVFHACRVSSDIALVGIFVAMLMRRNLTGTLAVFLFNLVVRTAVHIFSVLIVAPAGL